MLRVWMLPRLAAMTNALGAMHALYDSAADAVSSAEAGVRAAVEFDDGTGAPVESHVIRLPVLEVEELELLLKL